MNTPGTTSALPSLTTSFFIHIQEFLCTYGVKCIRYIHLSLPPSHRRRAAAAHYRDATARAGNMHISGSVIEFGDGAEVVALGESQSISHPPGDEQNVQFYVTIAWVLYKDCVLYVRRKADGSSNSPALPRRREISLANGKIEIGRAHV